MSISEHFAGLDAALHNIRWSWGSADNKGRIIVRAWDDEIRSIDGMNYIRLVNRQTYEQKPRKHPGYNERLRHIAQIEKGSPGYALILTAKFPKPEKREIEKFDSTGLWQLGQIRLVDGDEFGELKIYTNVSEFLRT